MRLDHLGLLHRDDHELGARLAPAVADALAVGDHVVWWSSPEAALALEDGLARRAMTARGAVAVLDPVALGADGDTVVRQLRALSARGLRSLVVAPSALAHGHRRDLVRLPDDGHRLICTCRADAGPAVVDDFRRRHPRLMLDVVPGSAGRSAADTGPTSEELEVAPVALRMTVAGPQELAELRRRLGTVLDTAGFDAARRARTVLAVHEAAVLAGRADGAGDGRPVAVRVRCMDGGVRVDVDGVRARPFVRRLWAGTDPLRIPRAFTDHVRFSRGGRIRLRAGSAP